MTPRPRRAARATAVAAVLAAIGLTGTAQANVQIPGLNGRIAFVSSRDFPVEPPELTKGTVQQCFQNDGCSAEIYSMNPDGSDQARLTNNTDFDDEPAWLPFDGANIAFESDRNPNCDPFCGEHLYSMASTGASPVQLTSDQGYQDHPTYSPDGTKIAYMDEVPPQEQMIKTDRGVIGNPPIEQIMIIPAGGESLGGPTPLLPSDQVGAIPDGFTEDGFPAWSPDGTQIAFTRLTESEVPDPPATDGAPLPPPPTGATITFEFRTFIAPASGGGPATPVEQGPMCTVHVTNTPPLVVALDAARKSLRSGDLRSAQRALNTRLLFPGCIWDEKPAWSPDGSKIAVQRLSVGNEAIKTVATRGEDGSFDEGDIVVFNKDGSGVTDLSDVSEPTGCNTGVKSVPCSTDQYPSWSPDGSKIAFYSDRDANGIAEECNDTGDNCDNEIWTMNANGTGLAQLTNNASEDDDPDWQRIPPPAPPAPPAATPGKPTVGVAGVRRACVSSAFHIRFHVATTASTVKSVVVKLDGKRIKSTSKSSFTLKINSKKLKSGRHRLTITATNAAGQTTTTHKSFSICKAAKPRRRAAPRFTG